MTHHDLVSPDTENHPAGIIQCHNIGHHWVTSCSTSGRITVYESLCTNLNDALKRQLVKVYGGSYAQGNGTLEVSVVLQQRHQSGGLHCGLFAIANAVALAKKLDPCTVHWIENSMREHFADCLTKKKIEIFPNYFYQSFGKEAYYTISLYCICLRFFPDAKMIHCSGSKNRYHYEEPKCITLSVYDTVFCHRCEGKEL